MREGLALVLVNSGRIFMFEGEEIHTQLLRMGDLAKVVLVTPQGYLGIQLLKSMLKPEDLYVRNVCYGFYKSMNLS